MIQRIQTVWFLVAILALLLMFFFPIGTKVIDGNLTSLFSTGTYQKIANENETLLGYNFPMLIVNVLVIIITALNIFNFKNRNLQKRVTIINITLVILFMGLAAYSIINTFGSFDSLNFGMGTFLPLFILILFVLALNGINKDENLIRSAERLR